MPTTKTYTLNVDGNAGQSVSALRREIRAMDAELSNLTAGTAEYNEALKRLAARKDDLGDLKERINALNPDAKIKGFLALGNAIAGAFSVATVAAQEFGLSGDSLEKYQKKVIGLLGVIQGLEALRSALEPQNFAGLKALASGFDFAAIRARFFGTTARAAIASTGIGLLVVAVGLLVANWGKVTAATERFYQRFKPQFDAVLGLLSTAGNKLRDFLSVVTFGLVDDAKTAAAAVAAEQAKIAAAALKAQDELLAKQRDERQKAIDKELSDEQRRRVALAKIRSGSEIDLAKAALEGAKEREASAQFEVDGTKERQTQYLEATAARIEAERALTKAVQDEYDKRAKAAFDAFLKRNPTDIKPLTLAEAKRLAGIPDRLEPIAVEIPIKPLYQIQDEQFAAFRQAVSDAVAVAAQIGQTFAAEASAALDEQITSLQDRQQALNSQLEDTRARIADAEKQLGEATGARRKFLIDAVDQQRAAETRLTKERDKAAKEQAAAERQRQKLAERSAEIGRIQTAVEATLAVIAGIRTANKSGEFSGPAAPFVIAATAAATIGAALSIRNALKFADGGLLNGPSHAQGGIRGTGRFGNIEVEGGEYVVNKRATARFLPLLETINAGGVQYIPRPTAGRYAAGGQLPDQPPTTAAAPADPALLAEVRALRAEVAALPGRMPVPLLKIGTYQAEQLSTVQAEAAAYANTATIT